jgi:hypothetical protein
VATRTRRRVAPDHPPGHDHIHRLIRLSGARRRLRPRACPCSTRGGVGAARPKAPHWHRSSIAAPSRVFSSASPALRSPRMVGP